MNPALRLAFLKAMSDHLAALYEEERKTQSDAMSKGDTLAVRDPRDDSRKYGTVNLSDPKATVRVTDEAALTAWMVEHYPELTEPQVEIAATDSMVKDVLFQHAPEFLRHTKRIKPQDLIELKAAAKTLGVVVGPGGEMDVPGIELSVADPVLTCRIQEGALPALLSLYREGRIEIDGLPRPQIGE